MEPKEKDYDRLWNWQVCKGTIHFKECLGYSASLYTMYTDKLHILTFVLQVFFPH